MKNREYGGYIEFEYFHRNEYHEKALALNSGRHCVEYLIRARKVKKLYIPYFMCDSVKDVCDKLGIQIEYYYIDRHFMPIFNKVCEDDKWLYLVNYYGQISNDSIVELKEKYENIIVDNVQAFFQKPVEGVDTIYTCRKFFGVSDGGYLYTDVVLEEILEQDYSFDRMEFLFGRMEKTANEFYSQYVANNELFATQKVKKMSKLTQNIMRGIDYESIKKVRTKNFSYLHEQLKEINQLTLTVPDGAFMYPLYTECGVEIRNILRQKKIYIPVLWPNVLSYCKETDLEYNMAKNILPLPIDQRYSIEDMEYIVEEVEACIV